MIQKIAKKAVAKKAAETYKKTFDLPRNIDELEDFNRLTIKVSKGNSRFEMSFYKEIDPYCCGLESLGEFRIMQDSTIIPQKEKINLIKEGFSKLAETLKNGDREYSMIFSLVDNKPCNLIREALKDESIFTCVKSFVNQNSGNKNDLYLNN